jgi:hypothetical protein
MVAVLIEGTLFRAQGIRRNRTYLSSRRLVMLTNIFHYRAAHPRTHSKSDKLQHDIQQRLSIQTFHYSLMLFI